MIGEKVGKRRGQGAKRRELRHPVEIRGKMLAPETQFLAQFLLLLDQISGQVGHRLPP